MHTHLQAWDSPSSGLFLPSSSCPLSWENAWLAAVSGSPGPHTVLQPPWLPTCHRAVSGLTGSIAEAPMTAPLLLGAGVCFPGTGRALRLTGGSFSVPFAITLGQREMRGDCHLEPSRLLLQPVSICLPVLGWIPWLRRFFRGRSAFPERCLGRSGVSCHVHVYDLLKQKGTVGFPCIPDWRASPISLPLPEVSTIRRSQKFTSDLFGFLYPSLPAPPQAMELHSTSSFRYLGASLCHPPFPCSLTSFEAFLRCHWATSFII